MPVIFAALAGFAIGAGVVGWWLHSKWQAQVKEANESLQEIANQHKDQSKQNRELKQQVADLQYQLTRALNNLQSYQNKD